MTTVREPFQYEGSGKSWQVYATYSLHRSEVNARQQARECNLRLEELKEWDVEQLDPNQFMIVVKDRGTNTAISGPLAEMEARRIAAAHNKSIAAFRFWLT